MLWELVHHRRLSGGSILSKDAQSGELFTRGSCKATRSLQTERMASPKARVDGGQGDRLASLLLTVRGSGCSVLCLCHVMSCMHVFILSL